MNKLNTNIGLCYFFYILRGWLPLVMNISKIPLPVRTVDFFSPFKMHDSLEIQNSSSSRVN